MASSEMSNDGLGKDSGDHARKITSGTFSESEEQDEQLCGEIANKITLDHSSTKSLGRSIHHPSSSESTRMTVGSIPMCSPTEMINERPSETEEEVQQLIPGVSDDVTLNHICTKLPWRAIGTLSLVSTAWRQEIRSHRVYDARLRSQSLETLVVHSHSSPRSIRNGDYEINERMVYEVLCLYSLKDKCCYELPGIPGIGRGIPKLCEWVSLDGKLYVLGGIRGGSKLGNHILSLPNVYKEVYVLDVTVLKQWKECAPMQQRRHNFGCGVLNGKIYAFGGKDDSRLVNASEVYDPETNTWSRIMPMQHFRCGHRISTQGEELVAHGGNFQTSNTYPRSLGYASGYANFLEIYHPGKDEWRVVRPFGQRGLESVFMIEGKLYWMTPENIYVHDADNNTWEDLHSNSYARFGSIDTSIMVPGLPLVVNDELLLKMSLQRDIEKPWNTSYSGDFLMKSKGFGSNDHEIVWHLMRNCGNKLRTLGDFMCLIQV